MEPYNKFVAGNYNTSEYSEFLLIFLNLNFRRAESTRHPQEVYPMEQQLQEVTMMTTVAAAKTMATQRLSGREGTHTHTFQTFFLMKHSYHLDIDERNFLPLKGKRKDVE